LQKVVIKIFELNKIRLYLKYFKERVKNWHLMKMCMSVKHTQNNTELDEEKKFVMQNS